MCESSFDLFLSNTILNLVMLYQWVMPLYIDGNDLHLINNSKHRY